MPIDFRERRFSNLGTTCQDHRCPLSGQLRVKLGQSDIQASGKLISSLGLAKVNPRLRIPECIGASDKGHKTIDASGRSPDWNETVSVSRAKRAPSSHYCDEVAHV